MAPQARAFRAVGGRPVVDVDELPAPAMLGHEARGRVGIIRGHVVAAVAAQRHREAPLFLQREIQSLAHVVEAEMLDHHVMDRALAGLDQREGMVTRVHVEEIGLEGLVVVITQAKAHEVAIEGHGVRHPLGGGHHMAEAQWPRAEARMDPPAREGPVADLRAVKELQPVADGVGDDDEILHPALVGQRA